MAPVLAKAWDLRAQIAQFGFQSLDPLDEAEQYGDRVRVEIEVVAQMVRALGDHDAMRTERPRRALDFGGRERSVIDQLTNDAFRQAGQLGELGERQRAAVIQCTAA